MRGINAKTSLSVVSIILFLSSARSQESSSENVTYQDLKNLGGYCEPRDSCSGVTYESDGSTRRDFYNSFDPYCDCGKLCNEYDTCCVNSPYRKYQTRFRTSRQVCIRLDGQPGSYFMVGKCSREWIGNSEIQSKCLDRNIRDPYTIIPALDRTDNVTYKNYFCGICNRVEPDRLTLWNITIHKKSYRDYSTEDFESSLTFDEKHETWGHWEKVGDKWEFVRVFINTDIPADQHLKRCIFNLVENCAPDWSDKNIANKCKSYTSPIHAIKDGDSFARRYRNIHCVICNSAKLVADDFCSVPELGEGFELEGGDVPPMSITNIFDVNPKRGIVGTIEKCKNGESYDPFFHKCRSLVCASPGYVLKNKRCSKS